MKRIANRIIFTILLLYCTTVSVLAAQNLVPVGRVIGLELSNDTVTVAAYDDTLTAARDGGLCIGDEILSIDGCNIDTAEDIRRALNCSDGTVDIVVSRDGEEVAVHMAPAITTAGPRLGVYLRQGVTGIGTVTFYDPATGRFGTLGHGVNDTSGHLLNMTTGRAFSADVVSIKKGKAGDPGQLKGCLHTESLLGTLSGNTSQGVFGTAPGAWEGQAIPVASFDEIRTGAATIRSTITGGEPQEYSVEILKIYPETRTDGRNLLLKVTDPALLNTTGGIVQGMSGSPLVQDGKLIGAVTHVLVNDPTMGYGIFIENMLEAAEGDD